MHITVRFRKHTHDISCGTSYIVKRTLPTAPAQHNTTTQHKTQHNTILLCYEILNMYYKLQLALSSGHLLPEDGIFMSKHVAALYIILCTLPVVTTLLIPKAVSKQTEI
jgi:hypothetical protein